jgi:transcriptional regulator with XRE-family HTH domain
MKTTTLPFDLRQWRYRMAYTQVQAAQAVGMSLGAYREAEYRCQDRPGSPCAATLAKLAQALERERVAA